MRRIRVLIVDDSALVRDLLSTGLSQDPDLEVVGTAGEAFEARDRIVELKPDVLTLDVQMPGMSGVEFLRRLMPQFPIPTVMVSSLTGWNQRLTLEALAAGAVDFVTKPQANVPQGLSVMLLELCAKIKIASTANLSHWKHARSSPEGDPSGGAESSAVKIIGIGASTGGTEAIGRLISRFPANFPGVLAVQHMPGGFTAMFAEHLQRLTALEVKEARDGDRVRPGKMLIAPGGLQMRLIKEGREYAVQIRPGDLVNGHSPSVDVLFHSIAKAAGTEGIGVVLTGMGQDGAEGLKAMRDAGGRGLAQDEATSVVFGMPKAAFAAGGAEALVALDQIPETLMHMLARRP